VIRFGGIEVERTLFNSCGCALDDSHFHEPTRPQIHPPPTLGI